MKQNLVIVFCLLALVAGSLIVRSGSSYAIFAAAGETYLSVGAETGAPEDGIPQADAGDGANGDASVGSGADADKTLEDIALDKRIAAQLAKNERTQRESGRVGSIPAQMPQPRLGIGELTDIIGLVQSHMRENPGTFPVPSEDEGEFEYQFGRAFDPRIDMLLYGETKGGIISGLASEDLAAWHVKKTDGNYTILVLARDAAGGGWRVLTEGDVYKLRKEMTDGD